MHLTTRVKAEDLFDTLDREKEQGKDRRIEVRADRKLEELVNYFEYVLNNESLKDLVIESKYRWISRPSIKYSSEDIKEFSLLLERHQSSKYFNERSGIFLSSLINESYGKDLVLYTNHLDISIDLIGFSNTKNMTIRGNAGRFLGRGMESGKIIVESNSKDGAGDFMTGGLIEIKGDADYCLGSSMTGGKIIVRGNSDLATGCLMENGEITVFGNSEGELGRGMKGGIVRVYGNTKELSGWETEGGKIYVGGNAGNEAGYKMLGGEIHINGDYESISREIKDGDIYHKGKLIIKDGKEISGAKVKWR
jgi:formylmethanofuran dehydrogenase subunit C